MNLIKFVVSCLIAATLIGCAGVPIAKDLRTSKKNLDVEIKHVVEVPSYNYGRTTYVPGIGTYFILALVSIENKTNKDMTIKLDKFDLAYKKEHRSSPSHIDMDAIIEMIANDRPVLSPKEKITRKIYYTFPLDFVPDRMLLADDGDILFPPSAYKGSSRRR